MRGSRQISSSRARPLVTATLLGALVLTQFSPVVGCLDECLVDYVSVRGVKLGKMELADARLNTWILGWVQHSLLTDPGALLDANIFYPSPRALTQSEHLLAPALLTLPLRAVTDNSITIHQLAVLLSAFLLAVFTAGLVRWLSDSELAALLAGTAAALMPWRLSELSHIQLLSAQWFPLVWWLAARILADGPSRVRQLALTAALTAQLLSSFYLAYYLVLSCAVLLLVWAVLLGVDRRRITALAISAAPAGLALLVASLPYLSWSRGEGFRALDVLFDSVTLTDAISITAPVWSFGWRDDWPRAISYEIPLAVSALGLIGFVSAARDRQRASEVRRVMAWGLLGTSLAAFVLVLGRRLTLGGVEIPLPAAWASALVPGFENLRSPLRWSILIGLCFPVLAGMGVAAVQRFARERAGARTATSIAVAMVLAALFLLTLPKPRILAAPAVHPEREPAYAALAKLPFGPVLEVPWPLQQERDLNLASEYMLGSTHHWRPITNGMSGYAPAHYDWLRQVAQGLPGDEALAVLLRVVDLRWIVVHHDLLAADEKTAWAQATRRGTLRPVFRDPHTWILEPQDWATAGALREELVDPEPRSTTLSGLSRAAIALSPDEGSLRAKVASPFRLLGLRRISKLVPLTIENRSRHAWPGFDVQTEGLVRLRYRFEDDSGQKVSSEVASLAADIAPQSTLETRVPVRPPALQGNFRLTLELVQERDGREQSLGIAPVVLPVQVVPGTAAVDRYEPSRE